MWKVITAAFISLNGVMQGPGAALDVAKRAGEVRTGDYTLHPPPPAEIVRREKLKREG
jgi:hypothetical protein